MLSSLPALVTEPMVPRIDSDSLELMRDDRSDVSLVDFRERFSSDVEFDDTVDIAVVNDFCYLGKIDMRLSMGQHV